MSTLVLTEALFAKIAGWEAMKQARALLERDAVLSSNWSPPVLKGVVQDGTVSYRAGLLLRSENDQENLCSCRASREWGTFCAHSVAVGLHHLKRTSPPPATADGTQAPTTTTPARSAGPNAARRGTQPCLNRTAKGAPDALAELHVILPPNLSPAVAKGRIMLCLEATWRGQRRPLNTLPQSQPVAFSPQDNSVLDQLVTIAGTDAAAALMLTTTEFVALLPKLADHPRVTLGKATEFTIAATPMPLKLKALLEPAGDITLALRDSRPGTLCLLDEEWVVQAASIRPLGLPPDCRGIFTGPLRLTRAQVPKFLLQDWPRLKSHADIEANFNESDFVLEPHPPRFLLHLAGGLAQLQAQLQCAYGPRIMTLGVTSTSEECWLPDPDRPTRYTTREPAAERAALARLQRSGFHGPDAHGRLHMLGQNQVLNFFARDYPRLQKEWQVTLEERLEQSTARNLERIEPRFQITPSGIQWFDLGLTFATGSGERFSAAEIQRLLLSGQSHHRLKNGRIALIDSAAVEELNEVLLDCSPEQHAGSYRIQSTQAGFLEATLRQQGWRAETPEVWRQRARQQSGETKPACPPLGDLENVLRPYQKDGVAWLDFLGANGFGGILADEMGLGKTLQALALIQARKQQPLQSTAQRPEANGGRAPSPPLPSLVVCPTSLVFNWLREAQTFTPHLRVLALQGPERRASFDQLPQCDLAITSYALIRRDAEWYSGHEFDTVILDEAQHIKNRQTQNAQAVKSIRARNRLVLTGTPLENSVLDLWSIFDFLMPGYLGSSRDFRERYELPIARERSTVAQERLARRLRPFLLRRTKREVAPELPPRIEQIAYCELTPDQRDVYQQVLEAGRRETLEAAGDKGAAGSRLAVLNALLRLRQVCCDLRLLKLENVDPATASGKMDLFGELLEEVIDGGHRALVFSQFVSLLSLVRARLEAEGIDYCYLDGSTTDRQAVVDKFQGDARIPVFLISLKAGGTGLNLTGADTVIHFDPWWNPAVEDQATDRAHRIGQSRLVTSYKLITRGTVEEKILALQARKKEVIQATLGSEQQLTEALTWEEIQELLA